MATITSSTKTLLKSGAALALCLGLATGLKPTPAQAGGKGAILFGAGVITGIVVHEAIKNSQRRRYQPQPVRRRPAQRVYRRKPVVKQQAIQSDVAEIQEALNTLGYDAGTVDGLMGPSTRSAVRSFQRENDYPVTGTLSNTQKAVLFDRVKRADNKETEESTDTASVDTQTIDTSDENESKTVTTSSVDPDQDWSRVQKALNALGYPAGTENGDLTTETREAAKAFQIDISHEPTGLLTEDEKEILFDDASDLASLDSDTEDEETQVVSLDEDKDEEEDKVSLLGTETDDTTTTRSVEPDIQNALALKEYKDVSSITDPLEQLEAVRDARQNPPAFLDELSATEKLSRESRLSQLEADVTQELITPLMEKAENAPVSITGVRRIASLQRDAQTVFDVIGPDDSARYKSKLETRQSRILAALVSDQVSELKGYPQSLDGLQKSSAWHERFMAEYGDFASEAVVADAVKTFEKDRAERLSDMVSSFEKDLAEMDDPASQASGRMSEYLSWSGDESLPIALEYKFLAAKYE